MRTQQVLARLMLDTERYDSSGWKMLDKSKSEGGTNQTDAAAVPAPAAVAPGGADYLMLRIEHLVYHYGERAVLNGVGLMVVLAVGSRWKAPPRSSSSQSRTTSTPWRR